jgi:hypothetical protein
MSRQGNQLQTTRFSQAKLGKIVALLPNVFAASLTYGRIHQCPNSAMTADQQGLMVLALWLRLQASEGALRYPGLAKAHSAPLTIGVAQQSGVSDVFQEDQQTATAGKCGGQHAGATGRSQ